MIEFDWNKFVAVFEKDGVWANALEIYRDPARLGDPHGVLWSLLWLERADEAAGIAESMGEAVRGAVEAWRARLGGDRERAKKHERGERGEMDSGAFRLWGEYWFRFQDLDQATRAMEAACQVAERSGRVAEAIRHRRRMADMARSYDRLLVSHAEREIERLRRSEIVVPEFAFLRREAFECGGERHQVAIYRSEVFARALGKENVASEFVLVPGGRFMMGGIRYHEEKPVHEVEVPSFLVARTPVVQGVWDGVGKFADGRAFRGEMLPIEEVSWDDIRPFLEAAGIRLPSEAEWEHACRAGTTTEFSFGDDEAMLGYYANWGQVANPVGEKMPNAFGLFHVHGNVWEWCEDRWHDSYEGAPVDGSAWVDTGASRRVVRGGSWWLDATVCRSGFRGGVGAAGRGDGRGFRPARSLEYGTPE